MLIHKKFTANKRAERAKALNRRRGIRVLFKIPAKAPANNCRRKICCNMQGGN